VLGPTPLIIPAQGEFGKRHPGWGREYRQAFFFTVYRYLDTYKTLKFRAI
jgi:hypothetical protein